MVARDSEAGVSLLDMLDMSSSPPVCFSLRESDEQVFCRVLRPLSDRPCWTCPANVQQRSNTRAAIRSLLTGLAVAGYYATLLQVYLILR